MARLAATYVWERWQHGRDEASLGFDRAHGVETHGWTLSGYEPIPMALAASLLDGVDDRGATFVDLGCGKGRVLLLAARCGFARVLGVEIDPTLADIARLNLRRAVDSARRCVDVEVLTVDALDLRWPVEPLVVFLYNPFPGDVVGEVLGALRASVRAHPRPCVVVYVHPLGLDQALARGWAVDDDRGAGAERVVRLVPA